MNYVYVLEINHLSVISFANIFSQSVSCVFALLIISFTMHKLIRLIRSHLFILVSLSFFFFFLHWESDLQNIAMIYIRTILPMFFYKSFMM